MLKVIKLKEKKKVITSKRLKNPGYQNRKTNNLKSEGFDVKVLQD